MSFERCGGDDLPGGWSIASRSDFQAATRRPHASQYRLSGVSAAPQLLHPEGVVSRRPQLEQKIASGSDRGPQAVQDGGEVGGIDGFDDVVAEAERSARTLAATMTSISSNAAPSS